MSEQKGFGSKILGLFVEADGQGAKAQAGAQGAQEGKSAAELIAELAVQSGPVLHQGASAPASTPSVAASQPMAASPQVSALPPLEPSVPIDFDAIFRDTGLDEADLDRVRKAEELLRSLPESTPLSIKKQIVEASLRAFGFEVDKIVLASQNQCRALDAFVRVHENATAKAVQEAEEQIRSLNEKIVALRGEMEKRTQGLTSVTASAQARKKDVQKVIDFFQAPSTPPAGV